MECNYEKGIHNMHNIFNSWKFKYLTIFDKLTVIKTFMLPQFTHIATVVSSLSAKQVDEIHRIWNKFIREGSPKVVDIKTIYPHEREWSRTAQGSRLLGSS